MQNLKSDSWKYETYAELERVKQLFMTGQSLSSLSRAGSLDDGSLSAGSPPPSMTPSGSCSSEEDGPFLLKRTLYVNPSIFCTVAVHGVSVEEYVRQRGHGSAFGRVEPRDGRNLCATEGEDVLPLIHTCIHTDTRIHQATRAIDNVATR
eukprot:735758-Pyramimonas_sp.AAC.1